VVLQVLDELDPGRIGIRVDRSAADRSRSSTRAPVVLDELQAARCGERGIPAPVVR
jgi:hypothetical protein